MKWQLQQLSTSSIPFVVRCGPALHTSVGSTHTQVRREVTQIFLRVINLQRKQTLLSPRQGPPLSIQDLYPKHPCPLVFNNHTQNAHAMRHECSLFLMCNDTGLFRAPDIHQVQLIMLKKKSVLANSSWLCHDLIGAVRFERIYTPLHPNITRA